MEHIVSFKNNKKHECDCGENCSCNKKTAVAAKITYQEVAMGKINQLMDYEQTLFEGVLPRMEEAQFRISDEGYFVRPKNCEAPQLAAYLPAMALHGVSHEPHSCAMTMIAATDKGLRYALPEEDGKIADGGLVCTPCMIGNAQRPSALLIPLAHPDIVRDGVEIAMQIHNNMLDQIDAMKKGLSDNAEHVAVNIPD